MPLNQSNIKDYFKEDGRLSSSFSHYEYRPQQSEMAEAVLNALQKERHLIVEAGTGVGKSLAYLIPLIEHLREGDIERAVVSTYTKTLQRQLIEKDLPFIREKLFLDVTYTLCLGSENYLCLRRLHLTRQHGLFESRDEKDLAVLLGWVNETETGIYMEITPSLPLWSKVCRETDLCHGRDCRYYHGCFYQKAKSIERKSQILVANHHLFFAHMASGWNVLPGFQAVVFDEAHEIERVASDYLGIEVSNTWLKYLLNSILSERGKGILVRLNWLDTGRFTEIAAMVERVRSQGERFFGEIIKWLDREKTKRSRQREQFIDTITEHLDALREKIHTLSDESQDEEEKRDLQALGERCRTFIDSLGIAIDQEMDGYVYWAEMDGRRIRFVATPIEIGGILSKDLFGTVKPVILTSATLSVKGSFSYIQERLGLQDANTLSLQSPFNYKQNVLLYIPKDMPDPGSEDYINKLTEDIERILTITMGRTLVLFTSYSMIENVLERITIDGLTLLRQGNADSYALIDAFKSQEKAVLFGTYTFWQGIDIPGNALQCVVITKLPFSVPSDPVIEARMESITAKGNDPFYTFQVPQAIITFKQGFGRLIRTASDSGIIAALDTRIMRRTYGRLFLESIPEVDIIHEMALLYDRFNEQRIIVNEASG